MRILLFLIGVALMAGCRNSSSEDEWEVEEIPLGYRGLASMNPYLAAERFLNRNGFDARSSRVWPSSDEDDDIIMIPASFLSTKGLGMRALDWVKEGGMLIVTVQGGEAEINDFRREWSFLEVDELEFPGFDHVMEEAGIEVAEEEWETEVDVEKEGHLRWPWHVAEFSVTSGETEADYKVEFEGEVTLKVKSGEQWDLNADDHGRMVTTEYGYGDIMVLSHARAFRNAYIDRADHAEFLKLIADWRGEKSIVFLYGPGNSFFGLLWRHAWQAIIAGLVLLLFWLWLRVPRFGPLKNDENLIQGGYGKELSASARFLWRKKQLHHYLRPLRERIEAENRDEPEILYQNLADQSGLSREEVVEAMTASETKDPASLTLIVRRLQTILKL